MGRIQILSIFVSLIIFIVVFNLVRRRKLKTEYSLIWLTVSVVFVVFSFWRQGIDKLASLLGISYPPSVLFIILLIGIILILIEFSIIISKQAEKIKILIQEMGLMKLDLEQKIEKLKPVEEKNSDENRETKKTGDTI